MKDLTTGVVSVLSTSMRIVYMHLETCKGGTAYKIVNLFRVIMIYLEKGAVSHEGSSPGAALYP